MGYQVSPGISFCSVNGRIVFLDALADRYFCLSSRAEASFARLAAGETAASDDARVLAGIARRGILSLVPGDAQPTPCARVPAATSSALDHPRQFSVGAVIAATGQLVMTRLLLRHLRFAAVLGQLERAKMSQISETPGHADALANIAWAHEHAGLFISPHDQCLARSLAVARQLARHRLSASLMIGVKLHPFAAHCWVQAGTTVVNDRIDRVCNFTPILVL